MWQSQLAAVTSAPPITTMTTSHHSTSTTSPNPITTTSNSTNPTPTLNGFAPSDLQALQVALQQQQHHLQQQLQNFLLFQQPNNLQTSAVLLQSQIQQAVAQATNQLRLLQRHQNTNATTHLDTSTPKRATPINDHHHNHNHHLHHHNHHQSIKEDQIDLKNLQVPKFASSPPLTSLPPSENQIAHNR